MKTVVHENVDGYEIVRYFGDAQVDPVATWSKIQDKILALPELAQMNSVKAKITAQAQTGQDAFNLAAAAEKSGNFKAATSYQAQYQAAVAAIPVLEEELTPLAAAFDAARSALFEANAAYFTPGPGESIISDADYEVLKAKADALASNQQLTVSGTYVADNRGKAWWAKDGTWKRETTEQLGVPIPPGAILEEKLSESQKLEIAAESAAARLAGLTVEEREAEKTGALKAAAQEAANQKTLAEITGEKFDAAAWYSAKKAEIEKIYK
ncbi:MAG: hypothetical protein KKB59_10460 [Spirochaetes bacterium]|nr:hypothetical protein [Spirochaetota bacterium]